MSYFYFGWLAVSCVVSIYDDMTPGSVWMVPGTWNGEDWD